ncbi:MAG: PilZ domain-containing protein [Candidatus Omnitrophica bacterium]|nr:PilZ domain-containing protein [Candidatus Omnitrophota bacterium]
MENNKRRILRLDVSDFLEMRPLNEVGKSFKGQSRNISPMGICFSSGVEWRKGDVLLINYFIPDDFESVKLKTVVIWSEFIDPDKGYFCGAQIIEVEKEKEEKFNNYYAQKLRS